MAEKKSVRKKLDLTDVREVATDIWGNARLFALGIAQMDPQTNISVIERSIMAKAQEVAALLLEQYCNKDAVKQRERAARETVRRKTAEEKLRLPGVDKAVVEALKKKTEE